jgi:predicted ATPase/DNA-binding winged helix-turn-helix (wHTH) protein
VYEAGYWAIDLDQRELRARGIAIPIGARAFEIIEVLVQSNGEVVTKEDLMDQVWPGTAVGENTLQVHISAVRKAFGPDRGMLKTAFGCGYRLLGDWTVRRPAKSSDAAAAETKASPTQTIFTNLPAATSDLIGRTAAAQHVRDRLSAYRVVTLTGPGGIGKTRLALDVARSMVPGFPDGTWLVELLSLSDPNLVPSAVAASLGLNVDGDEISPASIARAIAAGKHLLVLDNCEHVIDAAARLAEAVVRTCPGVAVMATSRELLRIDGEVAYRVPPLDVPPEHQAEPGHLLDHSAVQLFVARMTALAADFAPNRESLRVIAAICRRLDGIPLAIEFAAARAATLGIDQVIARLDHRFELLIGGRRTALPRHQTLRATLDWSYELLPEAEQHLLRRVAIFSAGFTLDGAAAVMSDTRQARSAVLEGIGNLVSKSLVTLDGPVSGDRWRLLETVRAYAVEKLAGGGETDQVARRHAEFFRDLLAPAAPASRLPPTDRMAVYGREIDNVRAAIDWAFSESGDVAIGITLTAAYVPVWMHLSFIGECRERAERALDTLEPQSGLDPHLRLRLHVKLAAALIHTTGLGERTQTVLAKAIDDAESLDDVGSQLQALWAVWMQRINNGENRAAQDAAERFLRIAQHHGRLADVLVGDRFMGNTMHYGGNQPQARRDFERMLDRYVTPDDQRHSVWFFYDQRVLARAILARVLWLQGFLDQAKELAQASLREAEATDHRLSVCHNLGMAVCPIALMTGDLATARWSVAMLMDLVKGDSLTFWTSWGSCLQAHLLIKQGDAGAGVAMLRSALDIRGRTAWKIRLPEFLGILAEGLARIGRFTEAVATIDEALADSDRDGRRWYVAELLRLKGDVLLQEAESLMIPIAVDCFSAALEVAEQQGALFWQLRAAQSLARLRVGQGRQADARHVLAPVYGRFTEGFDTADVSSARMLLDALA